ncbi:Chloroplast protein [Salix suchowensis]|nr:Chloroplast protein [Salix suchowensis]
MPDSEIELQERLKEAGNGLLNPPSSVDDLLDLLDKLERFLSNVDQAPPRSMQDALLPTMKALISSVLLRHSDEDVRFAVASCMSEITRITAPDAPYNDDQMKEIFQLTVASFKKLSHASGHCYTKAISILENVARVRSCLVMLDLELDELIIEMFQHFLKFIRSNHPQNVILAMETIMTLVIDESEEISEELLTLLLSSVKKQNQSISHIAQELGERVITNSATKLKPYLKVAVQSTGILLDEYAPIVASIFQDDTCTLKDDYSNRSGEHLGLSPNAACQGEVFEGKDVILKSKASKGTASTRNARTFKKDNASKSETEVRLEKEPKTVPSKRGWKPNSLMNPEEGYDPWFNTGRKTTKLPREKHHDKGTDVLPSETPFSKKVALSLKHSSVTKPTGFTSKTGQISGSSSISPQHRVSSGSHPKSSRPKKKGISMNGHADPSPLSLSKGESLSAQVEEKAPKSDDTNWRKCSKETSDSEAKKQKHSRKVGLGSKTTKKISLSSGHVVSAKKSDLLFEPEEMPLHQSIVIAVRRFNKHGLSVPTGTKKRRLLDGTSDEDVTEAFRDKKAKSLHRDGSYLEETPKTKFKRKRTPRKEVSSETPVLAEQLVGSKIKVWWPKDKRFYEGVVDSYDPIKKKHRVLYGDGDEEKLNLNRQRWELINDDIFAVQEQEIDVPKTATSSGVLQKAKSETKSNSLKRSKAVSSLKRCRAENISKTRARRSAYGAVPNEPTVVEKPADHNTSGPDSGSEDDGKNTPGPDSGSEDDGKSTSGPGSGSKDDGENSTVKLNIDDPLTDINSKQAVLETVNPSDNGGPKAGTEYGSFNSEHTTSVGVSLSKDESSKGDDESPGSDGSNREQQGGVSSSFSPETE